MNQVLAIVQLVVAVALVGCILLQAKGTGFGSSVMTAEHYSTKRGLERAVFIATIILTAIFGVLSILQLL